MGDMSNIYDKSSSKNDACPATDDMSLFLHQILLRSSSSSSSTLPSSSSSFMAPEMQSTYSAALVNDSAFGFADLSVGGSSTIVGPNVSSSSVVGGVVSENETDDCDCESEEGLEALVEEVPAKPVAGRSSSKRSRAAEVHNLSEKRRRSRINEKMKALQNLIPNSNKTDKASMLDEAIEYLKQLQLQVQMLSMRNGISLHPMCLPVMLQPIRLSQLRLGFGEESVPRHLNMTTSLPLTQETPSRPTFNFPDQCTASNQLSLPNMADIMSTDTSFGVRSAIQAHFGPFPLNTSSEARDVKQLCREEVLLSQQLNSDHAQSNTSEFELGAAMRVSLPYERQGSSLDAHIMGRGQTEGVFLKNMDQKHMLSSALNGRKSEETVIERPYI